MARADLLPDQVFRELVEGILGGRYAPGEALPGQRALAESFGVNLASLRTAITRLESLGLVSVRHGEGTVVRDWREAGIEVLVHAAVRPEGPDPELLLGLLEARRLLLTEAARLAAERGGEAAIMRVVELGAAVPREADDREAQRLDFAFWSAVVEASGNLVLVLILNTIRQLYLARGELFLGIVADRVAQEPAYAALAQALEDGDGDRAAAAATTLAVAQEQGLWR
ncbi:FadR/GntR family transcriptional regulator [Patulibacter defluvii]|uniref:FadR/GntR family transcriptional regulator n=1 Tax=Patulibacter defluvii TaxID=3095358 RepID=UPI002A762AED|nr:GntR family transcriptional regulator [Patulibacter sp. DM4]